jgi:hypothetical protein
LCWQFYFWFDILVSNFAFTNSTCTAYTEVAAPYKVAEFDMMFGMGISRLGCIMVGLCRLNQVDP